MMMMSSHTSVVSRPCLRADEGDDEGDEDGDDESRLGRGGTANGGVFIVGEDVGDALRLGVGVVPLCAVGVVLDDVRLLRDDIAEVVDAGVRDRLDVVRPDFVYEALEGVRGAEDGGFEPGVVVARGTFVGLVKLGGGGAVVGELPVDAEEKCASLEVGFSPAGAHEGEDFCLGVVGIGAVVFTALVNEDVDVGREGLPGGGVGERLRIGAVRGNDGGHAGVLAVGHLVGIRFERHGERTGAAGGFDPGALLLGGSVSGGGGRGESLGGVVSRLLAREDEVGPVLLVEEGGDELDPFGAAEGGVVGGAVEEDVLVAVAPAAPFSDVLPVDVRAAAEDELDVRLGRRRARKSVCTYF
mmetsp:Transcript_9941/g.27686  ORF Transcript_9941/g.27686 Transcript_9941/m.27686 type:complete len:356 (-) Transcript_9941:526-1593(-)